MNGERHEVARLLLMWLLLMMGVIGVLNLLCVLLLLRAGIGGYEARLVGTRENVPFRRWLGGRGDRWEMGEAFV